MPQKIWETVKPTEDASDALVYEATQNLSKCTNL